MIDAAIHWIRKKLGAFLRCEQGSVMVLVGAAALMLLVAVGSAVDMTRAQIVRSKMQAALDAAGLAAGAKANSMSQAQLNLVAQTYFNANFPNNYLGTSPNIVVNVVPTGSQLQVTASTSQSTTFMEAFGIQSLTVNAQSIISTSTTGDINIEVALVLDNTGSMACDISGNCPASSPGNSKIANVQTEANQLISTLVANGGTSTLYAAVVPFSQTVNIGNRNGSVLVNQGHNYSPPPSSPYYAGFIAGGSYPYTDVIPQPQYYRGNADSSGLPQTDPAGPLTPPYAANSHWPALPPKPIYSNPPLKATLTAYPNCPTVGLPKPGGGTYDGFTADKTDFNGASGGFCYPNGYPWLGDWAPQYPIDDATTQPVPMPPVDGAIAGVQAANSWTDVNWDYYFAITWWAVNNDVWGGCVMVRPPMFKDYSFNLTGTTYDYYYDTSDDPPFPASGGSDTSNTTQLFQDYFDLYSWFGPNPFNDYTPSTINPLPGAGVAVSGNILGPNFDCPQPITPLTQLDSTGQTTITNAINAMTTGGDTNIDIGIAWAWRVLSPRWKGIWTKSDGTALTSTPFAYNTHNAQIIGRKVAILLTDGMNHYNGYNYTAYEALGWGSNIIQQPTEQASELQLDARMLNTCHEMKENGIIIFVIGYGQPISSQSPGTATLQLYDGTSVTIPDLTDTQRAGASGYVDDPLLTACATDASHYYAAANNTQLVQAFTDIANSLVNLHVAQ